MNAANNSVQYQINLVESQIYELREIKEQRKLVLITLLNSTCNGKTKFNFDCNTKISAILRFPRFPHPYTCSSTRCHCTTYAPSRTNTLAKNMPYTEHSFQPLAVHQADRAHTPPVPSLPPKVIERRAEMGRRGSTASAARWTRCTTLSRNRQRNCTINHKGFAREKVPSLR